MSVDWPHARRAAEAARDSAQVPGPAEVTGVLLCGGQSRRMGRDKALVELAGHPLIGRPLAVLREVAARTVVATGSTPRYGELGCEVVLDGEAGVGPLAGLLAGLEAARTEWVAVLACDMPHARASTLRRLLAHARQCKLDVCLLELERGTQPLFGVYRRDVAPAVRAALARGERRMVDFHRGLSVGSLAAVAIAGDERDALNVNTPEDLEALHALERSTEARR